MIPLTAYWDRLEPLVKAETPDWPTVGKETEAAMIALPEHRRHGVALAAAERVRHAWSLTSPSTEDDDPAISSAVADLDQLLDAAWAALDGDAADLAALGETASNRSSEELRRLDPLLHALVAWAGEASAPTGFSIRYLSQRLVDFVSRTPTSITEGRRAWRETEFARPGSAEQIEATALGGSSPVPRRIVAWLGRDARRLAGPGSAQTLRSHVRREVETLVAVSSGPLLAAAFPAAGPIESLEWPSEVTAAVEAALDRLDAALSEDGLEAPS